MFRILVLLAAGVALVAFVTRAPRVRRALWVTLWLLGAYAVLKVTGVIEALAPARDGVL